MKTVADGGPAFPRPYSEQTKGDTTYYHSPEWGMTLRDWFAGQAMAGQIGQMHKSSNWAEMTAAYAYQAADAMLTEREKRK